MSQSSSTEPLILNYKRRRYDGGPEIELIEYLEAQHRLQENRDGQRSKATAESTGYPLKGSAGKSRFHQFVEVIMIGPLELVVGVLGMMTTGIAYLAFSTFGNRELNAQSRAVFMDCWDTFGQGLRHSVKAPVRAWKTLLASSKA